MFLFFHSDDNFLIIVVMEKIMIVCVEGNIGSGKSTLLSKMKYLVDPLSIILLEEPVDEWLNMIDNANNSILANYYKDPKKYCFSFQIFVLKTDAKSGYYYWI